MPSGNGSLSKLIGRDAVVFANQNRGSGGRVAKWGLPPAPASGRSSAYFGSGHSIPLTLSPWSQQKRRQPRLAAAAYPELIPGYIAMCETGSLQSDWSVDPPIAQILRSLRGFLRTGDCERVIANG